MVDRTPPRPRSRVVLLILIAVIIVLALLLAWITVVNRQPVAPPPPVVAQGIVPDRSLTPGAVDPAVNDQDICAHDWSRGDPPEPGTGDLTYSKAARHTSAALKEDVFAEYHLTDPHDGGQTYEVDHLVPLALGGRDLRENLWPESRVGDGMNAWAKDRLEYRLYRMVCDPADGAAPLPLAQAQAAFSTDWIAAYRHYCADEADCPSYGGN